MILWPAVRIAKGAYDGFNARGGDMQAGYIAYAMLLAIFPFLIFAVSFAALIIGSERSNEAVAVLFDFAPVYLAEVIQPVLVEVLAQDHGLFTIFIVLAIWAAMRAVEAINRAFDLTYGDRDVGLWLRRKLKALVTVLVSAVVAVVLGLTVLLAPVIINLVEDFTTLEIPRNITLMRYLFGIVVFYSFLWLLHWFLPNHHAQGFPRWPGAMTSTILWLIMATGLSVFLAYSGNYSLTYGALAGIVITMLFLYSSGAIIIFGAEVNAAVKRYRDGRL